MPWRWAEPKPLRYVMMMYRRWTEGIASSCCIQADLARAQSSRMLEALQEAIVRFRPQNETSHSCEACFMLKCRCPLADVAFLDSSLFTPARHLIACRILQAWDCSSSADAMPESPFWPARNPMTIMSVTEFWPSVQLQEASESHPISNFFLSRRRKTWQWRLSHPASRGLSHPGRTSPAPRSRARKRRERSPGRARKGSGKRSCFGFPGSGFSVKALRHYFDDRAGAQVQFIVSDRIDVVVSWSKPGCKE